VSSPAAPAPAAPTTEVPATKTTTTTPAQQRLKSVLRVRRSQDTAAAPIVEEKKADDTERLIQVASVVLQQEQKSHHNATATTDIGDTTANDNTNQDGDPIKAMLRRPFGRQSLPTEVARNLVVQVSSAEWDADEELWKYRILVQQRPADANHQGRIVRGSFTTAYTWRSLSDFAWLEQALRWEYHGALLVPLLNLAVGVASVSPTTAVPVEAEALRDIE